jgi:hypothetical protein
MLNMGGNIFRSFLIFIPSFQKFYACFVNHENIVIIAT